MTSTLSGIYDEVDSNAASMVETPYGTGAESPSHTGMGFQAWESGLGSPDAGMSMKTRARKGTQARTTAGKRKAQSPKRPRSGAVKLAVFGGKLAALFLFGVIYGLIVSHLHDTRQLTAVHMEGINRENWIYLISWGFFGVALGSLLPYVDVAWGGHEIEDQSEEEESDRDGQSPMSEQINDVVRSVAAFVGIAFAIVSSCTLLQVYSYTNMSPASTSLAVHSTTDPDARSRQPRALVHTRPLETRSLMLAHRHLDPNILHILIQSRGPAFAIVASDEQCDTIAHEQSRDGSDEE